MKKTFYVKPSVEVINVAIEKGFATSGDGASTQALNEQQLGEDIWAE